LEIRVVQSLDQKFRTALDFSLRAFGIRLGAGPSFLVEAAIQLCIHLKWGGSFG
jgi:hypothetical protein